MAKSEVSPSTSTSVVPTDAQANEVMACLRERQRLLPETDTASNDMLERYLTAGSIEELDAQIDALLWPLQGDANKGMPSLLGTPLRVWGVGWRNSDENFRTPGGIWIYAVMDTELENGKRGPVSTGGDMVLAYLARRWAEGAFPVDIAITKAEKETKSGWLPLNVHHADFTSEEPF